MDFLKPIYLWSVLAIAIPVLIHFWHQKKGQVMAWAAMQWLTEKEQQQHRGIRLENVWLLIVRCLVILVLALVLSRPILTWLRGGQAVKTVHLVQPDPFLTTNFRFELEEALKKGEPVFWANASAEPVENLSQLPGQRTVSPVSLQAAINAVRQRVAGGHRVNLQLYLVNNQKLAAVPFIQVPAQYQIHTAVDTMARPLRSYVALADNRKLFVNQANTLTSEGALDPAIRFQASAVRSGTITVLVDYRNKAEQQAVMAAVNALAEVYGISLAIETQPVPQKTYDWVLTDQPVAKPLPATLYVVSGTLTISTAPNVLHTRESLTTQDADQVLSGQLPEWLGERLVQHLGLNPAAKPLTKQELSRLFVPYTPKEGKEQEQAQRYFVVVLIGLIGLERWLALRKNA